MNSYFGFFLNVKHIIGPNLIFRDGPRLCSRVLWICWRSPCSVAVCTVPTLAPPLLLKRQIETHRYGLHHFSKSLFSSAFRNLTCFGGISTARAGMHHAHAVVNKGFGLCGSGSIPGFQNHTSVLLETHGSGVCSPLLPTCHPPRLCQPFHLICILWV